MFTGLRASFLLAVAFLAIAPTACGNGGAPAADAAADAAGIDSLPPSTCVQYGNEALLMMAIAGAHDGYFNWSSEGVECEGTFDDLHLTWEMPGLHRVTLIVPLVVAGYMAPDMPAQMRLVLSGNTYETEPDTCLVNIIQNYEHDPEAYPGIYEVNGNGECPEPAQPQPPATKEVNFIGGFRFAGYVVVE